MALRQARAASARATSKAPTAFRRSPPHSPTTCAGHARGRSLAEHRCQSLGRHRHDDARRRLREARFGRRAPVDREVDRESGAARERHLGERDREATVADVVDPGDFALDDESSREVVQRPRRVEIGCGRKAAGLTVQTAAHSDPPSSARVAPRTTIAVTRRQSRAQAARP